MITLRAILQQLRWDLIGKDSYRGISLTYAWLCNQWGHIAIGFIPAIFMGIYGNMNWFGLHNIVIAGLLISVIATAFEIFNYSYPLLTQRSKMTFEPAWFNVAFDTFTDLVFFYTGGLTAILVLNSVYDLPLSNIYAIALIVCGIYIASVFIYWYKTKMYIQNAQFPFQKRLSQWTFKIGKDEKFDIVQYIKKQEKKHILIFGGDSSGKTSLAVAIATEMAIKQKTAYYTTAFKFLNKTSKSNEELDTAKSGLWTWRQSKYVVIDDINSGGNEKELITPDYMYEAISYSPYSKDNSDAILNNSFLWVVGRPKSKTEWIDFVKRLGIDGGDILIINLS